jgi:hypothetical protein
VKLSIGVDCEIERIGDRWVPDSLKRAIQTPAPQVPRLPLGKGNRGPNPKNNPAKHRCHIDDS